MTEYPIFIDIGAAPCEKCGMARLFSAKHGTTCGCNTTSAAFELGCFIGRSAKSETILALLFSDQPPGPDKMIVGGGWVDQAGNWVELDEQEISIDLMERIKQITEEMKSWGPPEELRMTPERYDAWTKQLMSYGYEMERMDPSELRLLYKADFVPDDTPRYGPYSTDPYANGRGRRRRR